MTARRSTIFTLVLAAALLVTVFSPAPALCAGEKVSFHFVDVDITAVAKFVSDMTGRNFIYDERVRGKVTVIAPTKISESDAYSLFTSVLQLKGYAVVPSGAGAYKIVPIGEAKQSGVKISDKRIPVNEDFIARLIPVEHIDANTALKFVQPIISRNGYISAFGPGNLILIMDSGLVIDKVARIFKAIDKPFEEEEPEVIYLKHSDADEVARILNGGAKKTKKKGAKAGVNAVAVKRINALVLYGNKALRASMLKLIEKLDVETRAEQGIINVYFLENADAEEMGKVLKNLFTGKGPKAGKQISSSAVSITPDKGTNSLVIMASPTDFTIMEGVIEQLDRKRRQVFVEALIVEASLDKLRDLGSRWRYTAKRHGKPLVVGGVGEINSQTMQGIITGLSGMTVGGMGNYMKYEILDPSTGSNIDLTVPGFAALFSMSEFHGALNVLSSPQILTSDNTEAEIHVGENVPFISKTETNASGLATRSIERKDVGITLRIMPQITEGENVKLDIYQEISSVKESTETLLAEVGPSTTKRSTKTTVIVSNEQTVVISGLMEEREEQVETRVPLLHRIPLLGWLFKYRSTTKQKTNLLVFLTPHVIGDYEDLAAITKARQDTFARREKQLVEGHVVVRFAEGTSEDLAMAILTEKKTVYKERLEDGGYVVQLPKKMKAKKGIRLFRKVPEVAVVEPHFQIKTFED
jgi:general secretion pathway protein D